MNWLGIALLVLGCGSAPLYGQITQDFSNTNIKNDTGGPLPLMNITSEGGTVARLFITGSQATFGPNQVMLKGSGYVEALPGKTFHLMAVYRFKNAGGKDINFDEFGLTVTRIDWDEDGRTTRISGIEPVAETDIHGSLKILSDLSNPALTKDGALALEVEKLGRIKVQFSFGNFGGRITGVGPRGVFVGDPVLSFNKSGSVESAPPAHPVAARTLPEQGGASAPAAPTKQAVHKAQQQLLLLGYAPGQTDGSMGSKTIAALKKFQADHALPVTGSLDQKTLDALNAASRH